MSTVRAKGGFYGAGGNVIKLFTDLIYKHSLQDRMFVPGGTFQPSPMFVGKARSLP
jgi:hypothetical protein